jgi:hypothetical protein
MRDPLTDCDFAQFPTILLMKQMERGARSLSSVDPWDSWRSGSVAGQPRAMAHWGLWLSSEFPQGVLGQVLTSGPGPPVKPEGRACFARLL